MFQVIDAESVRTVASTSRFVPMNAISRAILRAASSRIGRIDDEAVSLEYVRRIATPHGLSLYASGAVASDGRQGVKLYTRDGRALLESTGAPVTTVLPTVAVSTLTLTGAQPYGWFLASDGRHHLATLVTTDGAWSDVLAQGAPLGSARRVSRMSLAQLNAYAHLIVAQSYVVVHRGFQPDGSGRPIYRIGPSASNEFTASEPYATLATTAYPSPVDLTAGPFIIEASNPVSASTPVVGTEFRVWIPG